MAAQEYDGLKEQLDMEQNLRVKAESYAHEVTRREHKRRDVWLTVSVSALL